MMALGVPSWDPSSASVAFWATLLVIGKLFLLRWHWPRIILIQKGGKKQCCQRLVKGCFFIAVVFLVAAFVVFLVPFFVAIVFISFSVCFQINKKETMRHVEGRWYFCEGRATQEIYMKLHPEEWIRWQEKNRNSRHLQFILKHGKNKLDTIQTTFIYIEKENKKLHKFSIDASLYSYYILFTVYI